MFDRYEREITYLRISVTDRCNLCCTYCVPDKDVDWRPRGGVLSFEEICEVAYAAADIGVTKIRLTGGEPLVRKDLVTLVSMLAEIPGVNDLSMTTNGVYLEDFARPLREAGLHRVNISLDATDPIRYAQITRGGNVARVLAGIDAAEAAGLCPIKLNCVIERNPDEPDARDVAQFAARRGFQTQFIRRMHLGSGEFFGVIGGHGGDCPNCNRLRLSSDGMVRPCLFSDLTYSVRDLGAKEALLRAIDAKPPHGKSCRATFCAIGG